MENTSRTKKVEEAKRRKLKRAILRRLKQLVVDFEKEFVLSSRLNRRTSEKVFHRR